jgi:uncharacterized protein (TIGR02646 family)
MRPVDRGPSPLPGDFERYGDAYPYLAARLEQYCSYCERYLQTGLAVEHIQPKKHHPHLELRWDNFLLGCVNCNSTKGHKDVALDQLLLPDRDNTFAAFEYTPDGQVRAAAHLSRALQKLAERTLALTGQNTARRLPADSNLRRIAIDRINQRRELWLKAFRARTLLSQAPSQELREVIVKLATAEGLFSIWMKVFEAGPDMRRRFLNAFVGTAADCFDPHTTAAVAPRPSNGLAHCGKS